MQCTQSDSFEEPTYGYVKEHCDYQPKEECQTVSYFCTCYDYKVKSYINIF